MRFFNALVGFLLLVTVCQAAVVQRRSYRNTQEILVPVAIIKDGEEFQENTNAKLEVLQSQAVESLETETVADDAAKASDEEKKLEAVEAVVEAQRRFDEAIVEEEVKEAIQEEENPVKTDALDQIAEANRPAEDSVAQESEFSTLYMKEPVSTQVFVIVQGNNEAESPAQPPQSAEPELPAQPEADVQPEQPEQPAGPDGILRQATQPTPTQTTTQQNFVQQLIQNSPLGQFFNQITGQNTQNQGANDDAAPGAPAPTLPGLFNPVTAVQSAAQTVVNSTTQAFAGLQQFASNLGNQFQNTLSGLTGQQANDATTARPPGPIQQFVNTFMGNPQQSQPAPTQQGPLQGLLNIFQGNRPQTSTAVTNDESQPAKEPNAAEQPNENESEAANGNQSDILSNEVRDSSETNDSFEQSVQPDEVIVVNDDGSQTSENESESENVTN